MDMRIGLIGCGGISGRHLPELASARGAVIWALCDIDTEKLNRAGDRYGVPPERRYTDYRQLIDNGEVDAVDICTPNYLHVPMAGYAAERGKHFCCEKPLGINTDETIRLKQLAEKNKVKSMVCFSYRFLPAVRYAKELAERGELGRVVTVIAKYLKSSAFMFGRRLDWRFVGEAARYGVSGDLGVHILDLASFLAGDVCSVTADLGIAVMARMKLDSDEYAPVETDDWCHFLARFDGGASGTFTISRAAYGNTNQICVDIYGDRGALRFDLNHSDRLEVYSGGIQPGSAIEKMETVVVPDEYRAGQMQCFVDLLWGRPDKYIPTLADGVKLQRVLDAILESDRRRGWVDIGDM